MNLTLFMAILRRFEPRIDTIPKDAPLHSVAFLIVADIWIKNIPEDPDTRLLRSELQFFVKNQKFSWQVDRG